MNLFQLVGAALTAVFFIMLIGRDKMSLGLPISLAASLLLLGAAVAQLVPVVEYMTSLGEGTEFAPYIGILLRALGIGLVCDTTADICRDAGETAIAGKVELLAKVQILVICLPLLQRILALAGEILAVG